MIIHLNILFQSIKKIRKIIYLYMLFFLILVLYTKFSMYINYNNIFLKPNNKHINKDEVIKNIFLKKGGKL